METLDFSVENAVGWIRLTRPEIHNPLDVPLREAREAFERAYFEHHLHREHGSMTRVAERTGLERTHLYRKLKQLGIDLSKGNYRRGGSSQTL